MHRQAGALLLIALSEREVRLVETLVSSPEQASVERQRRRSQSARSGGGPHRVQACSSAWNADLLVARNTARSMPADFNTASQGASERDALDRLLVRAPFLAGSISRGAQRLKPGSSLRRPLINLLVKRAFSAMARSDVEVILLSYEPDAEVWMRSMSGVGVSDCYRGHDGIRALYADVDEVFREWQWFIRTIADGGDAIAVRADFLGHGRSSGVETTVNDGGMATKLSDRGRVAWQEWFAEQGGWTKAVESVGLRG